MSYCGWGEGGWVGGWVGRWVGGLTSKVSDHRLEVEERFEAALGNFRLVGSVGRVPPRILQHIPQNDTGGGWVGGWVGGWMRCWILSVGGWVGGGGGDLQVS